MNDAGPWIFASVALFSIVMLSMRFRGFRLSILGLLALSILGGLVTALYYWIAPSKPYEPPGIPMEISAVKFEDLRLEMTTDTAKVVGRIRNMTGKHIVNYTVALQLMDCKSLSECDKVGEETTTEYVELPAYQVRSVEWFVRFQALPPISNLSWNYYTIAVKSENK